jgi:hypothetical protein
VEVWFWRSATKIDNFFNSTLLQLILISAILR